MSAERIQDNIAGGEPMPVAEADKVGTAAASLDRLTAELKAAREAGESDRVEQLGKARTEQAEILQSAKEERTKVEDEQAKARDAEIDGLLEWAKGPGKHAPSKAWMIGSGRADSAPTGYTPGAFAYNLLARKDNQSSIEARMAAEQSLRDLGVTFREVPAISKGTLDGGSGVVAGGGFEIPRAVIETAAAHVFAKTASLEAKATLGLTGATGGVLIPGATVADLVKPGRYRSAVASLVDSVTVDAYQTLIPVRVSAPTRAAIVAWGETKTNTNLTYGSYTATMYTLAIIYDLAKQFLRFSRGAAEADVMQELATAFELGRGYYILQGAGTTEPYGIQTAIGTAFGAFTTSFTASATTLAGSIAKAIATAAGDLAVRHRTPEAALLGPAAYWNMVSQGTDDAGFFFAQANGPTAIRPGTLVSPFGIPVYAESQLAGSDDLLVGEFSALDVFFGDSYRVDTSDEAGDRWDKNLVGFRGEQEMGLDARPAVFAGAFQFVADVVP
jgi:HK97 family phage major capsid protein